jgi:carbon storage regulator CsrA
VTQEVTKLKGIVMLVLSRRMMESLYMIYEGKDGKKQKVKIQIVGTTGKMVRLGIEAEKDVTILREELLDKERSVPPPLEPVLAG